MKFIEQLEGAPVEELEKEEADWRDAVERRVEDLNDADLLDGLPAIEELDPHLVDRMAQAAREFAGDVEAWGEIAEALIEARAEVTKKKRKAQAVHIVGDDPPPAA